MRRLTAALAMSGMLVVQAAWVAPTARLAQAQAPPAAEKAAAGDKAATGDKKVTGKGAAGAVRVRGTVAAIDKAQGTVTLKGPRGRTLTLDVQDRQKLDAIAVGDPVVAEYVEAVVVQVRKAGTTSPGTTAQETRASSKPGETPAGVIAREVSVTATITAIDRKAHTVTIKGPEGQVKTITAKDPKNLQGVKVGDMVEMTYTQALAVALDKPAK